MRYKLSFFFAFLLALTLAASAAPNRAVTTSGNLATTQTDINEELDELYEHTPASLDSFSGTNSYTASIEGMPALTSYDDGLTVVGKIPNTNTSTTNSLNIDSVGAITVLDRAGSSIPVGGLASGTAYVFRYFGSDNQFRVMSQLTTTGTAGNNFCVAMGDETTVITTGTAKVTFNMPQAMTLSSVFAYVKTASSSGLVTVDINEDTDAEGAGASTTILSTKITIDANERRSSSAATPPVISDSALAQHSEMTLDVDVAGTNAVGLKVCFVGTFS